MIVVWTPEAEEDRTYVWSLIASENPFAAVRMDELFSVMQSRGLLGTQSLASKGRFRARES
jgi:plasmid stabilization system protein ParE